MGDTSHFISVLMSPGLTGAPSYSELFSLWMPVCLLFITFFSGSLINVVISPSPDSRFVRFEDLQRHNYSFHFTSKPLRDLGLQGVDEWLKLASKSESNHRKLMSLKELFLTSQIIRRTNDISEKIGTGRHVVLNHYY